jgi:hypothetical protein
MRSVVAILLLFGLAYSANITLDNSTHLLAHNECYNVTMNDSWTFICAPDYPKISQEINLSYSGFYRNDQYNLTVNAPAYPKLNLDRNLTYAEVYTNLALNMTIRAPDGIPTAISRNLSYGERYEGNAVNISCAGIPDQNITITSGNNWDFFSTHLYCRINPLSKSYLLGFSDDYSNSDLNLNVTCPPFPRVNQIRTLKSGETATAIETNLNFNYSFTCENGIDTSLKASLEGQLRDRDVQIASLNGIIKTLNTSSTTTFKLPNCQRNAILYCPDELIQMCSPEEVMSSNFTQCVNRNLVELNTTKTQYVSDYAKCNNDLTQCRSGEAVQTQLQENMIVIIAGIFAIVCSAFLIVMYLKKKQMQTGDN